MSRFVFALAALSAVSGVAAGDFPVKTPLALPTPTRAALPGIHALAAADPSLQACTTASEVVSYCNDIQPTGSALASCLCCYNGDGLMDPVYSSCENYIVTSLPSDTEDYEVLTTLLSYCSAASAEGFDCGSVASTPTTTGGGGGGAADKAACTSFASVYSSCSDSIDDFTDLPDAEAASCLCYKGGKYTTVFDDYLSSCGVWAKTGDPVDYDSTYLLFGHLSSLFPPSPFPPSPFPPTQLTPPAITRLQTFCELFTPTTTVAASETALPPACQSYESIFSSCSNKVAGWSTIDNADAASCLCYKNGKYTTAFDDAVSGCGVWAKTASPDIYTCKFFGGGGSQPRWQ